jgi:carboxylesterase type B
LLLPVALYFHGGAFNFGNALDSAMDSFVSHEGGGPAGHRDVMVVTAAYRLGALGFLNGEGECNLGLKDQRAAVRWVADWAREFGGDGGNITVMGVSAGAHSVRGFPPPSSSSHG